MCLRVFELGYLGVEKEGTTTGVHMVVVTKYKPDGIIHEQALLTELDTEVQTCAGDEAQKGVVLSRGFDLTTCGLREMASSQWTEDRMVLLPEGHRK